MAESERLPSPATDPITRDPSADFSSQAQEAGLVLPRPTRPNPWLSIVVIGVVVTSALGLGVLTGWTDLQGTRNPALPKLYGPQDCGATPPALYGSLDPMLDSGFQSWWTSGLKAVINSTGGCVNLELNTSSGPDPASGLASKTSYFAAVSEAPNASEAASFPSPVVFYPLALTAVAVVYNLPGVPDGLNLTPSILAGIYSGRIASWDDPAIVTANPGVDLTHAPDLSVVYRTDASLANLALSEYLSSGNASWAATYGSGSSIAWPVGSGAASGVAVLENVAATPGSIGYAQVMAGTLSGVSVAHLENTAGAFVPPVASTVSAAGAADENLSVVAARDWANLSLVNAPGPHSYPLTSLAYVGLYQDLGAAYSGTMTLSNATWLMTVLWWLSESVAFAPLPIPFASAAQSVMTNVTYDGTPVLQVQESESGENGGETGEF
jgi:phosphate transport system substrate-binding protein